MGKILSIILISAFVIALGVLFVIGFKPDAETTGLTQNVEVRDGIQYVAVRAKGGYSPRVSVIQAGFPTKLIVATDNTYDCSASLVIPSIKFRKILQPTGQEAIDLGTVRSGEKIQVLCSMGMYNFQIKAI
ncbi:MAG: hypothetical protein RIQ54_659 [Candidatus Parcubacteria bacterium]|jgi:plastocyanin domain-containing protein